MLRYSEIMPQNWGISTYHPPSTNCIELPQPQQRRILPNPLRVLLRPICRRGVDVPPLVDLDAADLLVVAVLAVLAIVRGEEPAARDQNAEYLQNPLTLPQTLDPVGHALVLSADA